LPDIPCQVFFVSSEKLSKVETYVRADRTLTLSMLLQARGGTMAGDLVEELEVTIRTTSSI